MIKNWIYLLIGCIVIIGMIGCSNTEDKEDVTNEAKTVEVDANNQNASEEVDDADESLTLPAHFPADFPLPDNITVTHVEDEEDESEYSYEIRFTFDPDIDMDATFTMYDEYAKSLDYSIIIGGEEYFADGIFQFGATSKLSASDMFVVTLQPEGETFGDIQLKVSK